MLQDPDDPIRRAAETTEGALKAQLYHAWSQGMTNPEAIKSALKQAWRRGYEAVSAGRIQKDMIAFAFDRVAPESLAAADEFAARFVRELEDDQRVTLNATTQASVAAGLGPPAMAVRIRDGLGLTRSQATAVTNYRRALEGNSAKALAYRLRDKRFDPTTEAAVATGVVLSDADIDQRVARYRERYLSYRATTISRYETLFASNAGAHAAAQELPEASIKRWMLARDERVCPRCRSIVELQPDGVGLNEHFRWRHGKHSGALLFPPLHPSCFPGDAVVTASPRITGGLKRWYEGKLFVIRTLGGKKLAVTGDHPVFARRGWVLAREVYEGDDLVRCSGRPGPAPGRAYDDHQNVPAAISEIRYPASGSFEMPTAEMPSPAIDFESDRSGRQVDIVSPASFLVDDSDAMAFELRRSEPLVGVNPRAALAFSRRGDEALFARGHAESGCVSCGNLMPALAFGHGGPFEDLLLRSRPQSDLMFGEAGGDARARDAEMARQLIDGRAGEISFDKVVHIDVREFSGHVHNLETEGSYYMVDDLIVHNCRCTISFGVR